MNIIRFSQLTKPDTNDAVITIGTFDGFHKGHHALLDEVISISHAFGIPSVVVTFDPHPQHVVDPATAPKLLTTTSEKFALLSKTDIDYMAIISFTSDLRVLSAEDFIKYYIKGWLHASHMVIGYDHALGKDRTSKASSIRSIAAQLGINLTVVEPIVISDKTIKSSLIRKAIPEDSIDEINELLGHPYLITGKVVHGEARGKKLGFPTANLTLSHPNKLIPKDGVYLIRASIHSPSESEPFDFEPSSIYGIASIGVRPTFEPSSSRCIEIFLLDFDKDIYNYWLRVELLSLIRLQHKCQDADELISMMQHDVLDARARIPKFDHIEAS